MERVVRLGGASKPNKCRESILADSRQKRADRQENVSRNKAATVIQQAARSKLCRKEIRDRFSRTWDAEAGGMVKSGLGDADRLAGDLSVLLGPYEEIILSRLNSSRLAILCRLSPTHIASRLNLILYSMRLLNENTADAQQANPAAINQVARVLPDILSHAPPLCNLSRSISRCLQLIPGQSNQGAASILLTIFQSRWISPPMLFQLILPQPSWVKHFKPKKLVDILVQTRQLEELHSVLGHLIVEKEYLLSESFVDNIVVLFRQAFEMMENSQIVLIDFFF